ncbi:MAG: glutamine-hydrolyzing GMP synthase [Acidimicrobiales bacterium]
MTSSRPPVVLVVDFGAQYAQLIARRVREARVYSEIVSRHITLDEIVARRPLGVILSGGPASVHVDGAPEIDPDLYASGIPILGICYGAQLMARQLGGEVARTGVAEYGRTALRIGAGSKLLWSDHRDSETARDVWMSHGDSIAAAPPGFTVTASTDAVPVAALEDAHRGLFGVQFHPEVAHTDGGQEILERFLYDACGAAPTWTTESIADTAVAAIRHQVGDGRVLCGLSGGVDSSVAAALVSRAVGSALTCVFVDTGLMRAGEGAQVETTFRHQFGVDLVHVKAQDRFAAALAGVTDPEAKRKAVGAAFIRSFERVAAQHRDARFLVQGTLYPDVIESGTADAARIKSHHNVGGLPADIAFELVEPLRNLFKDEVRALGTELGLPEAMVWRQPFPGPGLAVRIVGEVTPERTEILRQADAVVAEEIRRAGLERSLWQAFAVLLAVRSVGVMGDQRTYAYPVVIRAVTSEDAMTADWARLPYEVIEAISRRIIAEVDGVNRVVLDVTSKPPGTIEWE